MRTEKLTISLPGDLVKSVDSMAEEQSISRSKLIASCIKEMLDRKLKERMIEGYKATAKSNLEFAESAIHLANEI